LKKNLQKPNAATLTLDFGHSYILIMEMKNILSTDNLYTHY